MAHEILVPPLGQTTDTVILATWYRQVGEQVAQGETLFAIETDKATLDIEAQASGVLARVLAQAGDTVIVLSSIGTILLAGEHLASPATTPDGGKKAVQAVEHAGPTSAESGAAAPAPREPGQRIFISPRAKRLAETTGVDWQTLTGTGPEGAIVERDIRMALATPIAPLQHLIEAPAPITNQQPAAAMAAPNAGQLAAEVDVSALATLCERLRARGPTGIQSNVIVTVADVIAWIAIKADQRHPTGIQSNGGGLTGASMGVLVAGEGQFNVKVIREPGSKSLISLSREIASSESIAKDATPVAPAAPAFLFADLGQYSLDTVNGFNDVQNSALLSIGRIRHNRDCSQTLWVTLSYSRAELSDFYAAQYFNTVVQLIEDPDLLF